MYNVRVNPQLFSSDSIWCFLDIAGDIYNGTQVIGIENDLTEEEADKEYLESFNQAIQFVDIAVKLDRSMHIDEYNVKEAIKAAVTGETYRCIDGISNYPRLNFIHYMIKWYNSLVEKYKPENYTIYESPYTDEDCERCENCHWEQVSDTCRMSKEVERYIPIKIIEILDSNPEVKKAESLNDIEDFTEVYTESILNREDDITTTFEGEEFTYKRSYHDYCHGEEYNTKSFTIIEDDIYSINTNTVENEDFSNNTETITFKVENIDVTVVDVLGYKLTFGNILGRETM